MAQDYYSILGVARDADPQEIKRAFRTIARECHPDVAGEDASAAERFKTARKAYETLIDPVTRARYDRRGQRRVAPHGTFFDAFYRATGEGRKTDNGGPSFGAHDGGGHASARDSSKNPKNDLDLEDLFSGFGFGGAKSEPKPRRSARVETPPSAPVPGAEVRLDLDVPARIARDGGTVTAVYHRMQRADSWRQGSSDPGLVRVQDIADVRVIPGTRDGTVLRERGLGDAGPNGGPYGDLVVRVRVVGRVDAEPRPEPPRPEPPRPEPPPDPPRAEPRAEPGARAEARPDTKVDTDVVLDVSLVEAMLGGRIELQTPQGTVRVTVPAGTSSDARLRLKGKGPDGPDGPTDLHVRLRIVVPKTLDEESRRLIEEFGRLNPQNPRDT